MSYENGDVDQHQSRIRATTGEVSLMQAWSGQQVWVSPLVDILIVMAVTAMLAMAVAYVLVP